MHKIVFVTGNKGKFAEIRDILKTFGIEVIQNKNGYPELQEDELEPIAAHGAQYVANKLNMPVIVITSYSIHYTKLYELLNQVMISFATHAGEQNARKIL